MVSQAKYYIITITDVNELLSFGKKSSSSIEKSMEEKRLKEAMSMFQTLLETSVKEKIKYIGEDRSTDKYLERYIFEHGGFMEIIVDQPLIIKLHFLHEKRAKKFLIHLKKVFDEIIPTHKLKDMFIESITYEQVKRDMLTTNKWAKMHHIYIQKSVVFTLVALVLVAIFEAIKAIAEFVSIRVFEFEETIYVIVIAAIIIAFVFEPVKNRVDHLVEKFMFK